MLKVRGERGEVAGRGNMQAGALLARGDRAAPEHALRDVGEAAAVRDAVPGVRRAAVRTVELLELRDVAGQPGVVLGVLRVRGRPFLRGQGVLGPGIGMWIYLPVWSLAMDMWNAASGIGALGAFGVSIWALFIARRANHIAAEGMPPREPSFEVHRLDGGKFRIVNVGQAPLFEATAVGRSATTRSNGMKKEPITLPQGGSLVLEAGLYAGHVRAIELLGFEMRDETRVDRRITVPLD
ncbi:hypothetical protein GCM10009768_14940 [Leucobacter iarius]|uniref:NfeD-like C-terminal domain-containing protein n=2 Tax=Leucobacter iarius TaxID=333963 RepID=A0ABP4XKX7_9MICO